MLLLVSIPMQLPLVALAKEPPANLQPLEEIPPPTIGTDENAADEPQITIVKKKERPLKNIVSTVNSIWLKWRQPHGVPYYMHKEDQDGGWLMDGPNQPLSILMDAVQVLIRFNLTCSLRLHQRVQYPL